jgi:hypothetical protein
MAKTINSHRVPTSQTRGAFRVFGKEFPFIQIGHEGHRESKEAAQLASEQYGIEVIAQLQKQKGDVPLTHREVIYGKLIDTTPPPKTIESLTPTERDPNSNPYLSVLAELNERPGRSPEERATSERRRIRYEHLSMVWQEQRDAQVALDRRNSDPEVMRMIADAMARYEQALLDPNEDRVDAAEKLLRRAESPDCTPGEYWQSRGGTPKSQAAFIGTIENRGNGPTSAS